MNWRRKFQLKDLLTGDDVSRNEARALGQEVAKRLRQSPAFPVYYRGRLASSFTKVRTQDGFNHALSWLYDVADDERIWVE